MVINRKNTLKNLKKKGFSESKNKSGDHHYLDFIHNGKLVLYTKLSHGSEKDLDDYLIKQMAIQCKLNKKDFVDLANCPLSKEDYIKKLSELQEL